MNQVVMIGRLTKEPELRYTPSRMGNCTFTLAVDRDLSREKKMEAQSKSYPTADFIRIVAWGKQGENCANYLSKGSQCAVQGRIQTGSYKAQDGSVRYTTDVVANHVEFLGSGQENSFKAKDIDPPIADDFEEIPEEDFPF